MSYIASIDQGTTSSRFILFDKSGGIVSMAQKEHERDGQGFSQELKSGNRNSKDGVSATTVNWTRETDMSETNLKMRRREISDCFRKREL